MLNRGWLQVAAAILMLFAIARATAAQSTDPIKVDGVLTAVRVDHPGDPGSTAQFTIGTRELIVPGSLRIEFPGYDLTAAELFARAPAPCRVTGETGLVPSDVCRRPGRTEKDGQAWSADHDRTPRSYLDPIPTDELPRTRVHAEAVLAGGRLVASRIAFDRIDATVTGAVTFVNGEEGYLRINGAFGIDDGGTVVRINDPEGRQSVQTGRGCGEEGNCSPDARFGLDTVNTSVRFDAGYAACVVGDLNGPCRAEVRPIEGALDAAALVPILKGDHVTARGGFEVHGGSRIFWAHTLTVHTSPTAASAVHRGERPHPSRDDAR